MAVPQLGGGPRAAARGLGAVPQGGGGLKVRAPAETGPLVVEGATKGRNKVDQSQAQAGPQAAQGDSAETRRHKKRERSAWRSAGVTTAWTRAAPRSIPPGVGIPYASPPGARTANCGTSGPFRDGSNSIRGSSSNNRGNSGSAGSLRARECM